MKTEDYGWQEAPPNSSAYLEPVILRLAKSYGARSVLDAGCGNGYLAERLSGAGFEVTAVDGDVTGVRIARDRAPQVNFQIGLFEDEPPGVFDFVSSTEVVEHLYSPHVLVRYCFDALKPGGILAMSTPYHGYLKNLALSIFDKWDDHHTVHWHGGHIKFWSRKTLTKLLSDAGFEVIAFHGVGRLPFLWKSMVLVGRKPLDTEAAAPPPEQPHRGLRND
ncbi:MAG TPA: methyltransferase domain-containing protein [Sphingomicrobium sp.]|nr:methyltransferase domain-containing protein [Sphingomicrobium sp.]